MVINEKNASLLDHLHISVLQQSENNRNYWKI